MKNILYVVIVLTLVSCGGIESERESADENTNLLSYKDISGSWESECFSDSGGYIESALTVILENIGVYDPDMQIWFKRKLHFEEDRYGSQIDLYIHPDCSDFYSQEIGLDIILRIYDISTPLNEVTHLSTDEGYEAVGIKLNDSPFSDEHAIGVTLIDSNLYLVRSDEYGNVFVDISVYYTSI